MYNKARKSEEPNQKIWRERKLWIGGDTRKHKDQLKAAGCRWSNNKKLWYWHHKEDGSRWHKGTKTINQIRSKYGSQRFQGSQEEVLIPT